jgi:hypothetical protein
MNGFWDISDLRFSHFYFSCLNYQELARARITKVVGFFTTNPTKLSSHFSEFATIFYAFYKFLQMECTIEDVTLRLGPWKETYSLRYAPGSRKTPRDFSEAFNLALGAARRRSLPDSGAVAAGVGGKKVGEPLEAHLGRFACSEGVGRHLAAAVSLFQRGGDFPGSVGESASSSRCQERWGTPSGATRRVNLVLAAAASNGAGGWLWSGRGALAQGGVQRP